MPDASSLSPEIPTSAELAEGLERLLVLLAEGHRATPALAVAGVANGGISFGKLLASELSRRLGRNVPYGTIDILFHRDDLASRPVPKITIPTDLPFPVDDAHILLADDVLHSGRTVRAALNEIFDQGRPAAVELVVVFDRMSASLPVSAAHAVFRQAVPLTHKVRVDVSESLAGPHVCEIKARA